MAHVEATVVQTMERDGEAAALEAARDVESASGGESGRDAGAVVVVDVKLRGPGEGAAADRAVGLKGAIEAMIVSSSRPVATVRISRALGLEPLEDEATNGVMPAGGEASSATMEGETLAEGAKPAKKRRSRKKAESETPGELIARSVEMLNAEYAATGRVFRIELVAGGYRLMTLPEHAGVIATLNGVSASSRLSRAAVESLAIIAYRQPVTKAHLEAIRGVSCGEVIRSLQERGLITMVGRAEELGRPMLYGTTKRFLETFGLSSVKDLPSAADLGLGERSVRSAAPVGAGDGASEAGSAANG